MFEFLLLLPIIFMIAALGAFVGLGLALKESAQIRVRSELWKEAARNQNEHSTNWTNYNTAGRSDGSWTAWDPNARGNIGSGAATGTEEEPRGTGEELDYLYSNAGQEAMDLTGNAMAKDYYRRIWNNLCGRRLCQDTFEFDTETEGFRAMDGEVRTEYRCDSPTWVHGQMPIWLIAQYGPMLEIRSAFETNLASVPQEFRRMSTELLHAWFEEEFMVSWNNPNAVIP